jgi:TonB family protein
MKQLLLSFALILALFGAQAQKKQNVYYLDKKGKEVKSKEEADFIRVIQEPDPGEKDFKLYEFYMDNKRKAEGKVSGFENRLAYEGILVNYDRRGIKSSAVNYKNGFMLGDAYYYFSNGKLHKRVEYFPRPAEKNAMGNVNKLFPLIKLMFLQDSLEVVAVKDGNGHAIEQSGNGKSVITEEGDYKDGFRDGIWTSRYADGSASYTETFKEGKFVSGESIKNGKKYSYTIQEEAPQFKGGPSEWSYFIASTVKYPSELIKDGIAGKVYTSFTIDTDGRITDIKIEKSVHELLNREAIRVLQSAPRWIPGTQRGIPVRVKYNQVFNFASR